MDMKEQWLSALRAWAYANESVRQLWLFGSRAKGTVPSESDIDIALALMPPDGTHDWALGNYSDLGDTWQRELEAIVGLHVSLEAITPGNRADIQVRQPARGRTLSAAYSLKCLCLSAVTVRTGVPTTTGGFPPAPSASGRTFASCAEATDVSGARSASTARSSAGCAGPASSLAASAAGTFPSPTSRSR